MRNKSSVFLRSTTSAAHKAVSEDDSAVNVPEAGSFGVVVGLGVGVWGVWGG